MFNILFSPFILFFLMAFIVELSLYVFRVQHPRIRSFCRCLPILKLPLGIIGLVNVNFFGCQSKSWIPQEAFLFFLPISLALILKSLLLIYHLIKTCNQAKKCFREVESPELKKALEEGNIRLLMTEGFSVPVAAGRKTILIPKKLINELSQREFDSVVAHELEHLRWHDPIVKFLCSSICSLFWWIPTRFWLKRLAEEQEFASDRGIDRFGIEGTALASALVKVVKRGKHEPLLCQFNSQKHLIFRRVEKMVAAPKILQDEWTYLGVGVAMAAFILVGYHIC